MRHTLLQLLGIIFIPGYSDKLLNLMQDINRQLDIFHQAFDKLEIWQRERPFLYCGICPYARTLIMQQISALEFILSRDNTISSEQRKEYVWWVKCLEEKLTEYPPDHDPPLADFLCVG